LNTSKELELLLQDLRLNPKRYIDISLFGKKQKAYVLPTDDPAKSELKQE
jgi:phospholipid/cholesterol/gamma-HCH transport system substrate-binding protein